MLRTNLVNPLGAGLVMGLALALAAPAGAGEIYAWRTDDGGYAFADDLRRVPERYRERVEVRQGASVREHERFTPTDDAAMDRYAAGLERRLQDLRRTNARLEEQLEARRLARMQRNGGVTVRFSSDGEPILDVPADPADGRPVVIEDVLAKPEGGIMTRNNTVIRRGDQVIAVQREDHGLQNPNEIRNEGDLDDGEF